MLWSNISFSLLLELLQLWPLGVLSGWCICPFDIPLPPSLFVKNSPYFLVLQTAPGSFVFSLPQPRIHFSLSFLFSIVLLLSTLLISALPFITSSLLLILSLICSFFPSFLKVKVDVLDLKLWDLSFADRCILVL